VSGAVGDWERYLRFYPFAVSAGAGIACLAISRYCFPYFAFDPDTAAYLFQAKLFAQGALAAPAPPDFGFSPSPHINIYNGLWFSKYPFGNSLFLVPGVLVGLPSIMPAIATAVTLLLFFDIVKHLFDRRVALLALFLAAVSPTTLLLGSSLLSQPTSRLCISIFIWSLLRTVAGETPKRAVLYGAAAGLALGWAFNTRPLVAVVMGAVSLLLIARSILLAGMLSRLVAPTLAAVAALTVMITLFFASNAYLTGDPWLLPYHALQAADRMGFGIRGEGYAPFVADFRIQFTPDIAVNRLWQHTLPAILYNATGWGAYFPNMLLFEIPERHFPRGAWLLLVPAGLIALPLIHRSRSFSDFFCAAIFLATLTANFFQYSDHSAWGATPLNTSYYNEATLFGLIPLIARGMLIIYDAARTRHGSLAAAVAGAFSLLFISTVIANIASARKFRNWDPHYQILPRLVADANLRNAVIFVPNSRNAPISDYPFVQLVSADSVYYRTGPLPAWRLNTSDWRSTYKKYFVGRSAYLFDGKTLARLDAEDR
jgi:4-amino-4-deoxy-L-arabinose transferase-like glycosyltransferase